VKSPRSWSKHYGIPPNLQSRGCKGFARGISRRTISFSTAPRGSCLCLLTCVTGFVFVPRRGTRRPPRSRRDGEVNRPALPLAEAARKCSEVRASLPPLRTVQVWVLPPSRAPEAATAEETICRVCHTHEHDV
jgi:hypothetical protein